MLGALAAKALPSVDADRPRSPGKAIVAPPPLWSLLQCLRSSKPFTDSKARSGSLVAPQRLNHPIVPLSGAVFKAKPPQTYPFPDIPTIDGGHTAQNP
ncbi:predicted protein [Histoplasma capsulatum var. duboisii H88]|uniref:Predicted protein n=1 Tax=Ajellomyces capsulatus (strain H88) TaxID=544711 RepID=F0U5B5_AJEC8|nr:predicted protein [Histoplasma capsulatum var. duboisii H88]